MVIDEVREHRSFDAWAASSHTISAVLDAQVVCITNQGDDEAVVLDSLRNPALEFIERGDGDPRLGLFEWSAPDGSRPDDVVALAQANPNAGHRVDMADLLAAGRRAQASVIAQELTLYKTEVLCMRVPLLNPAVDPSRWSAGAYQPG